MIRSRRGQIPLKVMIAMFIAMIALLAWNTWRDTRSTSSDGRQEVVAWGITFFGDEIYTLIHQFEQENPQYKLIVSSSAERDTTSDGQRLLCAVAGGVPPDVYFFARFATGEWASRNALTDLGPMLAAQDPNDPHRINLDEYYPWAIKEASYRPPGSNEPERIYSIPTTGDIRMLYLNKDLLRQAGLVDERGEPRAPKTWDELREYANRLTVYRTPGDKRSGIARLGFAPNYGNSWLYMYAWQAGGELLSPDRTRVTFDSPPVVRALRFMADVYDDLGGPLEVDKFRQGQQGNDLDPFLRGLVAMKIDNDWTLRTIADYRPDMDFLVAPAPMPADELAKGRKPITWAGGFSLVIPTTSKNKAGAFKLIQYITSWQGTELLNRGKREAKAAEGRMFIPESLANRVQYERLVQHEIFDNPRVPKTFKDAQRVMLEELMPNTLFRPVTPVGQLLWNQHVRAYEAGIRHEFAAQAQATGQDEMKLALATYQKPAQEQLDAALAPPPPVVVKWGPWFALYGALVVAPFAWIYIAYRRRRREQGYRAGEIGAAMLFVSPWAIGFIVFIGGPIVFSILFSFTRYDVLSPARYVGAANYLDVLRDGLVLKSIGNTAFMILRIPLGMAVSLAIALMLNRAVRAIGFYRTAFYMPAIVPMVAGSLLWVWMFNPTQGLINRVLLWFTNNPPQWLNDPRWSKPAMILMSLWAAGAGMIIWLAGLQAIPQQLYEAASIDGAGKWRRFVHVTLPMLSPYILFNAIVGLIATMQIFGEAYIMTPDGRPADSTLFYAYYLFKQAFQYFRMGYAAALAWILFVAVLALTLVQLWLGKKWVTYDQS